MTETLLWTKPTSLEENDKKNSEKTKHEEKKLERETGKCIDLIPNVTTTTTPKSIIIIPGIKSQATSRKVTLATIRTTSGSTISPTRRFARSIIEKRIHNGDLYIGTLVNNTPHGSGKYLWKDGCIYKGDWKRGKASGKGKLSWPSGATFEGEFKSGRMEGSGTYIGSEGEIYKGSWSADRKHGYGVKHYSNGDYYEGQWKKNLQDGQGRYVWKNGNEYKGEWKSGMINGRGVLVWNNGNTFDGNWESGIPKGHGVFTWPDGSCYIGSWSKDSSKNNNGNQVLNGTFYPEHNKHGNEEGFKRYFNQLSPLMVVGNESVNVVIGGVGKKRSSVDVGMMDKSFPRICIWESDGEDGDITCDIIDNVEASMLYRDGFRLDCDGIWKFRRNPSCLSGEVKKPGQTISRGHKNYDLMLNLQLGIRYSIGKYASILRDLKPGDFDPNEKFWTRFPPEGSRMTPPHQSAEFRWKDYCPVVFRHLRELFQVDPTDYMLAICENDALREFSSPGKSGSCFYLTQDDRFMIKTVKKSEVKVLIKMLHSYYKHVYRYENSLVTKFCGVHCVKPVGGVKTRFIVMGNLFCSEYRIHRRNWYQELIKQIDRDCEFLEAERIMDYSLLVGLHFRDDGTQEKMGLSPFLLRTGKRDSCRFLEAELQDMDRILAGRKPLIRLGANMPARAERVARRSDFDQYGFNNLAPSHRREIYEVVLYFGIIDILQDYDISKKLEHAYKSLQADPTSISAVDPKLYSKRFRDFVGRIFVAESLQKNIAQEKRGWVGLSSPHEKERK
ncbi:unnamed protein product [Fraxinus pennsylvanica]|uniref:Phosphatidylinositol 4-phosphate 5-kinase n=1 Tax=Fraxinus pennsylvanica TaxID=56036 RepID=A0AAD2AG26_9LAMI|nr:unnamed protein product [Fraxinus pennsylvanica]